MKVINGMGKGSEIGGKPFDRDLVVILLQNLGRDLQVTEGLAQVDQAGGIPLNQGDAFKVPEDLEEPALPTANIQGLSQMGQPVQDARGKELFQGPGFGAGIIEQGEQGLGVIGGPGYANRCRSPVAVDSWTGSPRSWPGEAGLQRAAGARSRSDRPWLGN